MPELDESTLDSIPLTDERVIDFVIDGYIKLAPDFPPGTDEAVCQEIERAGQLGGIPDLQDDPLGLRFIKHVPTLKQVFSNPTVHGAITSLLGRNYFIFHRMIHSLTPNSGGRGWHRDDVNYRHYQVRRLMILYYPQKVTPEMGPTYILPGTHLRHCSTDYLQTYGNIRGQIPLIGEAGMVYIAHYDIWHSASCNKSARTRHLVKYYVDRSEEPISPNWTHNPERAIFVAMNRMQYERNGGSGSCSELFKERNLRWQMWSYLLGKKEVVEWSNWDKLRSNRLRVPVLGEFDYQGYPGMQMY
jgi:hypothetical protein